MSSPGAPSLPAIHALHLAELVGRWGVSGAALLAGAGLVEADLALPDARLSIPEVERLVARARALTGEDALGLHLGFRMRASAHGALGFAAMTSETLGDALELAVRFAPTRTTALALSLEKGQGFAALVIEERADLGTARDVVLVALLVGLWQIGGALTGRELEGSAELALPAPAYHRRLVVNGGEVRFGQPANRLLFDAAVLELPLAMADPPARRLALEPCERALDALGATSEARSGLPAQVRGLLPRAEGGFLSLEEVAAALHVSARTLKRRLASEGLAFSTLLEQAQREQALRLLEAPDLTVDAIAERLGYSDTANFGRAFRRWTGTTPAAHRRANR